MRWSSPIEAIRHLPMPRPSRQRNDEQPGPARERLEGLNEGHSEDLWDGPSDPENPRNWSKSRKRTAVMLISMYRTTTMMAGSFIAPALSDIAQDLQISSIQRANIISSVYILAFAIGPLLFGPASEVFGRAPVLHITNVFFLLFNVASSFSTTASQMTAFRFLGGIAGSAPMSLGGALLSDIYTVQERGSAYGYYTSVPLVGFALGPIPIGFLIQYTSWRWAFHILSILTAAITAIGFFCMKETNAPVILEQKRRRRAQRRGTRDEASDFYRHLRMLGEKWRVALPRPFHLLLTQPLLQVMALFAAFVFGLDYLAITTFPVVWQSFYSERPEIGAINYVSLALGYILASQVTAPLQDRTYRRLMAQNSGIACPEFRVPIMLLGSLLVPLGLFWYGWSLDARLHWIMPNIGACIFAMGIVTTLQATSVYLVEAYEGQSASAIASVAFTRSIAGFAFPIFAPSMYNALGYGWGSSVLGFFGVCIGIPTPILLWHFGFRLRSSS